MCHATQGKRTQLGERRQSATHCCIGRVVVYRRQNATHSCTAQTYKRHAAHAFRARLARSAAHSYIVQAVVPAGCRAAHSYIAQPAGSAAHSYIAQAAAAAGCLAQAAAPGKAAAASAAVAAAAAVAARSMERRQMRHATLV